MISSDYQDRSCIQDLSDKANPAWYETVPGVFGKVMDVVHKETPDQVWREQIVVQNRPVPGANRT